jgi:hypothetical protein
VRKKQRYLCLRSARVARSFRPDGLEKTRHPRTQHLTAVRATRPTNAWRQQPGTSVNTADVDAKGVQGRVLKGELLGAIIDKINLPVKIALDIVLTF